MIIFFPDHMQFLAEPSIAEDVTTYTGLVLTLVLLLLAFIAFCLLRGAQTNSNTIHKNLTACLFLVQLLFLTALKMRHFLLQQNVSNISPLIVPPNIFISVIQTLTEASPTLYTSIRLKTYKGSHFAKLPLPFILNNTLGIKCTTSSFDSFHVNLWLLGFITSGCACSPGYWLRVCICTVCWLRCVMSTMARCASITPVAMVCQPLLWDFLLVFELTSMATTSCKLTL